MDRLCRVDRGTSGEAYEHGDVALLAGFVLAYGLVSRRVEHSVITGPMVFVGFGLIMGTAGFDLLEVTLYSTGV